MIVHTRQKSKMSAQVASGRNKRDMSSCTHVHHDVHELEKLIASGSASQQVQQYRVCPWAKILTGNLDIRYLSDISVRK